MSMGTDPPSCPFLDWLLGNPNKSRLNCAVCGTKCFLTGKKYLCEGDLFIMRKTVQILGFGKRMSGTGKNGKPYDFQNLSFAYEDQYTTGLKATSVMVNGSVLGEYAPSVGDMVDMVFHEDFKANKVYVDAIL